MRNFVLNSLNFINNFIAFAIVAGGCILAFALFQQGRPEYAFVAIGAAVSTAAYLCGLVAALCSINDGQRREVELLTEIRDQIAKLDRVPTGRREPVLEDSVPRIETWRKQ